MSERQNIDRLFQEKFKDFEVAPPEHVWNNIQSKISTDTKKTQPSLPSWLKLGGTAVALLIGLFLFETVSEKGIHFLNDKSRTAPETKSTTAGSDKNNTITTADSETVTNNSEVNPDQTAVDNQSVSSNTATDKGTINASNALRETTAGSTSNGVSAKENSYSSYSTNTVSGSNNKNSTSNNSSSKRGTFANGVSTANAYAVENSGRKSHGDAKYSITAKSVKRGSTAASFLQRNTKINNGTIVSGKNATANQHLASEKALAVSGDSSALKTQNTSNQKLQNNGQIITNDAQTVAQVKSNENNKYTLANSANQEAHKTEPGIKNEPQDNSGDLLYENNAKSKIAYESGNRHLTQKNKNKAVVSEVKNESAAKNNSEKDSKTLIVNSKGADKITLNEKATNSALSSSDSIAVKQNTVAKNSEKKGEKEATEEKDKKDTKRKDRWTITSSTTPVYMNLNGYGSTIDSKFDNNSKSYLTKMSYGAGVKYALNEKWAIQTGVSTVNFEYNTNDITFYHSNRNNGLEHVTPNGAGTGIVVENPDPKGIAYDSGGIVTTRFVGDINHRISYVEVPMQLNYKLLNKKFGIDVIGGFSTLFLNENRVSVVSAETSIHIGEANNLNRIHFSTNAGLGFHYNFMKALQVNFEPMFKYQINTFKSESDNFKPYFIGLYSGISYKF
ncbi:PorT family protein [Flavobacterium sp. SM15]|uniref:outer membrane beta-barrel protein n=1 Tax=Flavobacterium sp. SM15 TaxID=2908005 RepID=UPI001EDB222B|nr:outer membrane beta-barrel protein [Flavobacterium sp. SM15]MCG2610320.1 PorT family protein [Flavobacterium sp. SM15]